MSKSVSEFKPGAAGTVALVSSFVIGGIILLAVLMAAGAIVEGWALATLWGWFVVGTFNVPELSLALAIGLILTVRLVCHNQRSSSHPDEKTNFGVLFSILFIRPLLAVGLGYIVYAYLLG